MSMEQQFRGAMFGGFNRQDVVNYIETTARAHAQQIQALQEELEQMRQAVEAAGLRAATAEAQVEELSPQAAWSDQAAAQLQARNGELERMQQMVRALQDQVARLTPKAEAYDAVKDQMASLELAAHQRAKQVTDEARRKAEATRGETAQWLIRVRASYDRLRADMEATLSHAAGELERSSRALAEAGSEFREHDAALVALSDAEKNSPQN